MRDEHFNKYKPMVPQGKVWQVKSANQPVGPVGPPQPTGLTGEPDRSDHPEKPVRPVEPSAEPKTKSAAHVLVPFVDEAPAPPAPEDEELVDYEASLEHTNMKINVVHLSSDYFVVPKEDVAHL